MEVVQSAWQVMLDLGNLALVLLRLAGQWWLLIAWLAWWTFGVNWKKSWQVLAQAAWVPLVLLMIISALVWSRLAPSSCECLGFTSVPNFWWQLGEIGLIVALTFFCGWLQGYFHWTPAEVNLDPPAPSSHGHDHGHGHH